MSDPFISWYTGWGDAVIVWVQTFRSPIMDELAHGMTLLGDNRIFIGIIAALYWTVSKRLALSVAFLLSLTGFLNTVFKNLFAVVRPSGPGIAVLESTSTYSLPSGHAQSAASVWSRLALGMQDPRLWMGVALLLTAVSVSRVYRAAHYPGDVIIGVVFGLAILLVTLRVEAWAGPRVARWPLAVQVTVPVVLGIVLFTLVPGNASATATGGFIGIAAGAALENRYVRMRVAGSSLRLQLIRVVLGAGGLLVILAVDNVFTALQGARFQTAIVTGLWISLAAPALFSALHLAGRDIPASIDPTVPTSAASPAPSSSPTT